MSFTEYEGEIREGSLVLAWLTRTDIKPIRVTKDEKLNTRYGCFRHNDMIGMRYGTQMPSMNDQGFIHLMAPTPELWTLSLPHRTQIVYTPDSSYIVQRLRIRPGSRVIEAGTGSGSFTHALARTVGSCGHVFSYEFHEARFHEAKKEFEEHGLLEGRVTLTHRDVCQEGFDLIETEVVGATAVFLDLPAPWTAVPWLKTVVDRTQAVGVCCFSPCIEQVVKTVEALRREGFQRIEMVEVNAAKWESRKAMVKSVDEAIERLRDVKRRREEGLQKRRERMEEVKAGVKHEREEEEGNEEGESTDASPAPQAGKKGYNPWGKGMRVKEGDERYEWRDVSRVEAELKSHTSYLTFAVLPPPFPESTSCN
ncbi:hypothetical protein TRICI_005808 [Trichomonascus ciferrii]|uniref:tRNA (adenine(58)-N(1))-methyltransferase catalytic subunit TRM61 n=1 Tax=Trichomonascus ciferrii TaxID=44093 RepID=A0A642UW05_9ASCO|nr:hypothetical protein TRICI_005808 [Trichomonascus ciferrii]